MYIRTLITTALITSFALASPALASDIFVRKTVNLRAGPNVQYPVVERVAKGSVLNLYGCLDGWSWCEIGVNQNRGWVSGKYIETVYNNHDVRIIEVAPQMQVPIVVFEAGPYWDTYYREKPFYSQRDRWAGHSDRVVYVDHGDSHAVRVDHDDHSDRDDHHDFNDHQNDRGSSHHGHH